MGKVRKHSEHVLAGMAFVNEFIAKDMVVHLGVHNVFTEEEFTKQVEDIRQQQYYTLNPIISRLPRKRMDHVQSCKCMAN